MSTGARSSEDTLGDAAAWSAGHPLWCVIDISADVGRAWYSAEMTTAVGAPVRRVRIAPLDAESAGWPIRGREHAIVGWRAVAKSVALARRLPTMLVASTARPVPITMTCLVAALLRSPLAVDLDAEPRALPWLARQALKAAPATTLTSAGLPIVVAGVARVPRTLVAVASRENPASLTGLLAAVDAISDRHSDEYRVIIVSDTPDWVADQVAGAHHAGRVEIGDLSGPGDLERFGSAADAFVALGPFDEDRALAEAVRQGKAIVVSRSGAASVAGYLGVVTVDPAVPGEVLAGLDHALRLASWRLPDPASWHDRVAGVKSVLGIGGPR